MVMVFRRRGIVGWSLDLGSRCTTIERNDQLRAPATVVGVVAIILGGFGSAVGCV